MSNLLIDEYPLIVLPTLAAKIGLNEAIFLQQLNYWLGSSQHHYDGRKWVYNTFEEWQKQLPFWPVITIKRIVKSLRDSGIIVTTSQYNKMPLDRTLWYSIDREKLDSIIKSLPSYQNDTTIVSKCYDSKYQNDTSNNQRLPETTTSETTSDQGEGSKIVVLPPTAPLVNGHQKMKSDDYDHPITANAVTPPTAKPPPKRVTTSPHFDPRKLVGGYIPAGQGATAIEIYFERFSATTHVLTAPNQDDITSIATNLERWRQVVTAWQQSGHKPGNIKGMLDWYHDPSRIPGSQPRSNGKEKSNGYHATAPTPAEPAVNRYAKLKAGKAT